jgi:hypothetical protein
VGARAFDSIDWNNWISFTPRSSPISITARLDGKLGSSVAARSGKYSGDTIVEFPWHRSAGEMTTGRALNGALPFTEIWNREAIAVIYFATVCRTGWPA